MTVLTFANSNDGDDYNNHFLPSEGSGAKLMSETNKLNTYALNNLSLAGGKPFGYSPVCLRIEHGTTENKSNEQ